MKLFPVVACVFGAFVMGCGRLEPTITRPQAPHGGTIVGLPNGLGNVEVVREAVDGKPDESKLFLYFIDAGGKPIVQAPTAANLKPKERRVAAVSFKPAAGTDSSKMGALESSSVRAGGDISGELSTVIAGKPVAVIVNIR